MAKFQIYKDNAGQWRWRFKADNGRIVADSAEGYATKQNCTDGIDIVKKQAPAATAEEL